MDKPTHKIVQKTSDDDDSLTHDDLDMLETVLSHVRGSAPNDAYVQADFTGEFEPEA